jgi:hypothetical protein
VQRIAQKMLKAEMFDFACTDIHHLRHLEALNGSFTKASLADLFDKYHLRNNELQA